jgi:chitinase
MAVPVLSVGDVTVREPVLGDAAAVFTVLLSEASDVPVSVAWATGEGTGAHPASGAQIYMVIDGVKQVVASSATRQYLAFVADFIHDRDTLTFAPGETAKTVTIAVRGENVSVDAAEESFVLVLGDAVGATIGRGTAVATIIDSAVPSATVPAIVVAAGSAVEPPAGFGPNLHAVRVALQHPAVFEGAGLAFVDVDDHQARAGKAAHDAPFARSGKTRAAQAAQA